MKKSFSVFVFFTIVLTVFVGLPPGSLSAQEALDEKLILNVGEIKVIDASKPSRVAIGNPEVADVTDVTADEITHVGKSLGLTNLIFWDVFGAHAYKIRVLPGDMQEVKERIDRILEPLGLQDVYTRMAPEEGTILILGKVTDAKDRERVLSALSGLKDRVQELIEVKEEESVVEIDVQVLELNEDGTRTLGFTHPTSISATELGSPAVAQSSIDADDTTSGSTGGTKWSNFFKVLNLSRNAFNWQLDLLVKEGKARILSRPRLACQSGKEAELLVGGEKPLFTTTVGAEGGEGTEIEYKGYGIILNIKPTVTDEDRIKVALSIEVSEVGESETIGPEDAPTAKAFPLSKRSASTELFLDNGQTLAIGGLMRQKMQEDVQKTPFLGDIPILGLFFRQRDTKTGGGAGQRENTELFITLTPTIVSRGRSNKVAQRNEEVVLYQASQPAVASAPQEGNGGDPLQRYVVVIQRRILEHLDYPANARQAGFQGTVKLSLHLSHVGELLGASVLSPSQYKVFDDSALAAAKEITAYPPFPPSLEQDDLWIEVPIVYRLD